MWRPHRSFCPKVYSRIHPKHCRAVVPDQCEVVTARKVTFPPSYQNSVSQVCYCPVKSQEMVPILTCARGLWIEVEAGTGSVEIVTSELRIELFGALSRVVVGPSLGPIPGLRSENAFCLPPTDEDVCDMERELMCDGRAGARNDLATIQIMSRYWHLLDGLLRCSLLLKHFLDKSARKVNVILA